MLKLLHGRGGSCIAGGGYGGGVVKGGMGGSPEIEEFNRTSYVYGRLNEPF